MTEKSAPAVIALASRHPRISGQQLAAELVPPQQFAHATFDSYRPDPAHSSQATAREMLQKFVAGKADNGAGKAAKTGRGSGRGLFGFGRKKTAETETAAATEQTPEADRQGVYLDGGFGVGKTHLLAAAWHAQKGRKYFGTFIEYTALVGALGYDGAVNVLAGAKLVCIDEFELDDPGDTMLMTRLLKDLAATGTKFVATSNTPPNALGEGRFAAADFMREIQSMSDRFTTIRIDGEDYRQRNIEGEAQVLTEAELQHQITTMQESGKTVSCDTFTDLLEHLSKVHPSNYAALISGIEMIAIADSHELSDQSAALRFVAFIDRVYDAQIPMRASGTPLNRIFGGGMLDGGYRKKYLRCMSRVNALCAAEQPGAVTS